MRPYFKKSIVELERIFKQNRDDPEFRQTLLDELAHRTTQRARNLQSEIKATAKASPLATEKQSPPEPEVLETTDRLEPETPANRPRINIGPKPSTTNDPQNILRTWTALEVLSPQGYRRETDLVAGDRSRIARFEDTDLPWKAGERSRPKKRLYYELILGAVALAPAVEALLKLYAD